VVAILLAALVQAPEPPVRSGLDALVRDGFAPLRGRRVGLVTNPTGIDARGRSAIDLIASAPEVRLVALLAPEHGLRANLDQPAIESGRDERTGIPIHSLYGKTRKPTPDMLRELDVLVFDLQDVGARFYTYITTLALVLEAARENGKDVVVLDRPNPIGGDVVEGPVLEEALRGRFIGYFPLPTRHGMTVGELARLYNEEFKIGARLTVVPLEGWRRSMFFDETGLPWVNPSPNMRSLEAALSYPGLGALEGTNLSVGRGTPNPFVRYGAPWIDERGLCEELNGRGLAGVRFKPVVFRPEPQPGLPRYPYTNEECRGFEVEIADRKAYRPVTAALHALDALHRRHRGAFSFGRAAEMIGRRDIEDAIRAGRAPAEIERSWREELQRFLEIRRRFLLYR
jgi:uncharacterized protein YbbC (DUF1343 family)